MASDIWGNRVEDSKEWPQVEAELVRALKASLLEESDAVQKQGSRQALAQVEDEGKKG